MSSGVSILIPTYNRPDYLGKAVESCLAQSLKPSEIIIGDDSSDDRSWRLYLEKKDVWKGVEFVRNEPALGQPANICMLSSKATGDYTLILHDDDLLLPKALEIMVHHMNESNDTDVVYGKQIVIDKDGKELLNKTKELNQAYKRTLDFEKNILSPKVAALLQQIPNNCYLAKTSLFKRINQKSVLDSKDACDFYLGYALSELSKNFGYIGSFVSAVRVSENSISKAGEKGTSFSNAAYYVMKMVIKHEQDYLIKNKLVRNHFSSTIKPAIVQAARLGDFEIAWKWFWSSMHFKSFMSLGWIQRLIVVVSLNVKKALVCKSYK